MRSTNPDKNNAVAELTICTVSHHSTFFLDWNWKLTKHLNSPANSWKWLVVENTPKTGEERLPKSDTRFEIIEGDPITIGRWHRGSTHHALGLNKALEQISTRFALFLDPDFYIIRPNWIHDVIEFMRNRDLTFFGVPWHPKWYVKYRYFPCPHALFIDLSKVDRNTLDFLPDFSDIKEPPKQSSAQKPNPQPIQKSMKSIMPVSIKATYQNIRDTALLIKNLRTRRVIGQSQDTGYRIYKKYAQNANFKYQLATPVFRVDSDFLGPKAALSPFWRLLEQVLPDRWSYIPKQPEYFQTAEIKYSDNQSTETLDCEEFFWQHAPFGFHLRNNNKDESAKVKQKPALDKRLTCIIKADEKAIDTTHG